MKTARHGKLYVADALISADALEKRLIVLVSASRATSPATHATLRAVHLLVNKVREAAYGRSPKTTGWQRWWHGALIEVAYQNYHAARVVALEALDSQQLRAEIPGAVERVRRFVDREDARRLQAEDLLAQMHRHSLQPAQVGRVLEAGFEAADNYQRSLRNFRNIVLMSLAGVAILVAIVTIVVMLFPSLLPLCFTTQEPIANAPVAGLEPGTYVVDQVTHCPTGSGVGRQPHSADILVVIGMGVLGGAFASMVSIRNLAVTVTPYAVPVALARLKVPAGALTALIGIVAIRGQFVPGLTALDSQEQIIAYALIFGYAQQLATMFLDERAEKLQAATSTSRPEPQAPTVTPRAPADKPQPSVRERVVRLVLRLVSTVRRWLRNEEVDVEAQEKPDQPTVKP